MRELFNYLLTPELGTNASIDDVLNAMLTLNETL